MCYEGSHVGESSGRSSCGKGSGALTNRNRALECVEQAARPTDQEAGGLSGYLTHCVTNCQELP
jgi:hypothetical protein